jgi:predicted DNA-binding transcriptional regulator
MIIVPVSAILPNGMLLAFDDALLGMFADDVAIYLAGVAKRQRLRVSDIVRGFVIEAVRDDRGT